jgi:ketosteroid isomerase-like protein
VEIVRRLYELPIGKEFLELLDPHVVWINYSSAFNTRPYVGRDGVVEWAKEFADHFANFRVEAKEVTDAGGNQVVVVSRFFGTGSTSGIPVEREFGTLFILLNGKIVRCQGFETATAALEAAGLRE